MVFQGEAKLPLCRSLPPAATKKNLPPRTVNDNPSLARLPPWPATCTTISPLFAADPNWNVIFSSDHTGYSAAAPPPTVTVELPLAAPKPFPQIVTHAPLLFCPPVFGPLSRSEKKILGDEGCPRRQIGIKI